MNKSRFIVRARQEGSTLTDFLAGVDSDPQLEVVDTIGPVGRVHTAVVNVAADQVPGFEQRYGHSQQLMIERDRRQSLLDKTMALLHRSEKKNNA